MTYPISDQIAFGVVLGGFLGTAFCYILKYAQKRGFIDRESFVAMYLALALFSIGLANLLGTDDLLTAFAAGTAISWDGEFNVQTENDVFAAILDLVLNSAAFIYIGAWYRVFLPPFSHLSPLSSGFLS
jgi:NhaP-type Na+/H+ or K+/H+ antiporter